jgi:hypothetical protein
VLKIKDYRALSDSTRMDNALGAGPDAAAVERTVLPDIALKQPIKHGGCEKKPGVPQFRWTRQLSPAARNLEHSVSAAWRVFASMRTRVQIGAPPSVVRLRTGS